MGIIDRYSHWKYKNSTLLLISLALFLVLARTPTIQRAFESVGDWGYFGAIIIGMFSVMTFTAGPSLVVLYYLAEQHNTIELSLLAGIGSVIGDFIIFSFFRDKVFSELEPIVTRLSKRPFMHIFHSPYFAWLGPVMGAIIIASPLPDELGVTLLSASKMAKWQFVLLSFALNTVGLYILITAARAILE